MNELIGKRMLLTLNPNGYGHKAVEEYRILEVSPSGNWIKLMSIYGKKFWKSRTEISVVEELKPLNTDRPAE